MGRIRHVLLNAFLDGEVISGMRLDISEQKHLEQELKMKSRSLEELNSALKVVLAQREKDKREMEESLVRNVKELVLPHLDTLKQRRLGEREQMQVDLLERNLKNIVSPFLQRLTFLYADLTPAEIKVADLIKEGKTAKEIAAILGVAETSINTHKQRIRNKLGITHKKTNLKAYLASLT